MTDYTPHVEFCRHWAATGPVCNQRAQFLLWGKLFPKEALGPRCSEHASEFTSLDRWTVSQSAVMDWRGLYRTGEEAG